MTEVNDLSKLVNASGFAFQLGVEHAIRERRGHGWEVVSREHPWRLDDANGFIDLVLKAGSVLAVVECKRTRDGTWVFLVPAGEDRQAANSRVHWVAGTKDGHRLSGLNTIQHAPLSYISSFCVVRGSGENDRPMLERLCATLLTSADALAEEEVGILARSQQDWQGFYLPIIVTTAELHVCRLDPSQVSLTNGGVESATFESVPFLRFRKAFGNTNLGLADPEDLEEAGRAQERTVWIVQASELSRFLSEFRQTQTSSSLPWNLALKKARESR